MRIEPTPVALIALAMAIVFAGIRLGASLDTIGVQLTRIARAVLGDASGQDQKATVPATAHRALEAAQEIARRKSV